MVETTKCPVCQRQLFTSGRGHERGCLLSPEHRPKPYLKPAMEWVGKEAIITADFLDPAPPSEDWPEPMKKAAVKIANRLIEEGVNRGPR